MDRDKAELNARMDRHQAELNRRMERDKAELFATMDRNKAELEARIDQRKKAILGRIAESDARHEEGFAMVVAQLQELNRRWGVLEGMVARSAVRAEPREQVAAQAVPDSLEDSNSEER